MAVTLSVIKFQTFLSSLSLYHPTNLYPVLFGAIGSDIFVLYSAEDFLIEDPPFVLKVIVYVLIFHFANNGVSPVTLSDFMFHGVFNSESLNHPANVYPFLVVVIDLVMSESLFTEIGDITVPPLVLKVTLYLLYERYS